MSYREHGNNPISAVRSLFSAGHLLLVLSVLLPAALFAGAAWYARDAEMKVAQERVAAITNTLAGHAQATFQAVELLIARVSDRVAGKSWDEVRSSRELHDFLADLRRGLPQVESIFVVAPDARIAVSSRSFPAPDFDARDRDREYFKGADQRRGFFVSEVFRGQAAGTNAFTVSRSLYRGDVFDGVIGITINPAYFEEFYRTFERPGVSTATLVRQSDGALLVRYPNTRGIPERLPPNSPLRTAASTSGSHGQFIAASSMDGEARIGAFARLDQWGLLVNYNLDRSAVLGRWYANLAIFAVFALLAGLALFVTARLTMTQAARQQKSLQLLLAETERRQEAEAKLQHSQKMEALGRLTGGVAHDFNNLLAAILGGIDMARKRIDEPKAVRLLGMAAEAAERGAKLTKQMLAFSRKQEVAFRPVESNDVLRGMDELLRRTIGGLIRIRYDLAGDAWPILIDPVQLEVAILNLAVNARDAMPFGGDLALSTRNVRIDDTSAALPVEPGDYVVISVADSGQGMAEDVKLKAFEPFFTTKGPGQGTGLGLSMVFGLAAQAGGTATIESAPGRGTKISLYARRAAVLPDAGELAAPREGAEIARSLRILVVDDNGVVCNLACEMLHEAGHIAKAAESGREALEILKEDPAFDLLIADYAMPSMNGSQLAAEAGKLQPTIGILFMTGYVEHDALRAWLDRGYRMLSKPFTAKELEAAVQSVIGSRPGNVVQLRAPRVP